MKKSKGKKIRKNKEFTMGLCSSMVTVKYGININKYSYAE
jgi:hypothetical protein